MFYYSWINKPIKIKKTQCRNYEIQLKEFSNIVFTINLIEHYKYKIKIENRIIHYVS